MLTADTKKRRVLRFAFTENLIEIVLRHVTSLFGGARRARVGTKQMHSAEK